MRRFNLKYNRTRQYSSRGDQIPQTFNNTPLQPAYRTQNARFEAKNCCINACSQVLTVGGQTPHSAGEIVRYPLQGATGILLQPLDEAGGSSKVLLLNCGNPFPPTNQSYAGPLGTFEDELFIGSTVVTADWGFGGVQKVKEVADRCNCTIAGCSGCPRCLFEIDIDDQDVPWFPAVGDYVYVFNDKETVAQVVEVGPIGTPPFAYRIVIAFDHESCNLPGQINQIVIWTAQGEICLWPDGEKPLDASGAEFTEIRISQLPSKKGGRVGAPHRNPIAGARKARDCCNGSGCLQQITLSWIGTTPPAPPRFIPAGSAAVGIRGLHLAASGALTLDQSLDQSRPLGSWSIRLDNCTRPFAAGDRFIVQTGESDPSVPGELRLAFGLVTTVSTAVAPKQATNTVYADNYARSCAVPSRFSNPVCYDKRIRSGMQPKQKFCIRLPPSHSINESNLFDSTTIPKPRKLFMCPNDYGYGKSYNYSYAQYLHNGSCKSFRRSQEKFLPIEGQPDSACPAAAPNSTGSCKGALFPNTRCCLRSQYRKSGCQGCCPCDQPPCNPGKNSITVYKPNNKKFSKQGAVSAGSRLERLKLDTIRAANSKCPKGQRCIEIDGQRYGKGKYLAGRPAFMGQIYNARHPETTCMRTYRQQPFGIPQLTNKQRATRSRRVAGWKPTTKGSGSVFQRGNSSPRAPGCKCPQQACPNPCSDCGVGQESMNPGAPCCAPTNT